MRPSALDKTAAAQLNGKQREQHRGQRGQMVREGSDLKLTQPSGGGGTLGHSTINHFHSPDLSPQNQFSSIQISCIYIVSLVFRNPGPDCGRKNSSFNRKEEEEPDRSAFMASLTSASCRFSASLNSIRPLYLNPRGSCHPLPSLRSATCGLTDSVTSTTKKASDAGFCCINCGAPRRMTPLWRPYQ